MRNETFDFERKDGEVGNISIFNNRIFMTLSHQDHGNERPTYINDYDNITGLYHFQRAADLGGYMMTNNEHLKFAKYLKELDPNGQCDFDLDLLLKACENAAKENGEERVGLFK